MSVPGSVPYSFSTSASDYGLKMGVTGPKPGILLLLRVVQLVFSFLAFVIMAANDHYSYSFKDWHGYNFIVAATFLTAFYALIMSIYQGTKTCSSNNYWGRGMLFAQVVCDFILLLLLWGSACAGGVQATQNNFRLFYPVSGQKHYTPSFCHALKDYRKNRFCPQAEAAVAFTFFTSFTVMGSFWMLTAAHFSS